MKARLTITGEGLTAAGNYSVVLNDEELNDQITDVSVSLERGTPNRAYITFMCSAVEIDGDFEIVHRCGLDSVTGDDEAIGG